MGRFSAFNKKINLIIILALALAMILNYWYSIERQKLNHHYEQSIERREELNNSFEVIIQDYQEMVVLLRSYVQKLKVE